MKNPVLGTGFLMWSFQKDSSLSHRYQFIFIIQGQQADRFYIVADGTLKATRSEKQGEAPKECATYK